MKTHTRTRLVVAAASLVLLACEDRATQVAGPQGSLAGEIMTIVDGNNQLGVAGGALSVPLTIQITTSSGSPINRAAGSWTRTGGGTISASSFKTNSQGKASVNWTLGTTGAQTVTATMTNGPSVTFTATIVTLGIASGNNQAAAAGATLASKPMIIVRDGSGNPVAGATGSWGIASGGGFVSTSTWTTDASGLASVDWTLGSSGTQTLTATRSGGGSVSFTARLITIAISQGNNQSGVTGTTLPIKPRIIVRDASSLPVAGVTGSWIVASGGGSTSSPTFTTDANGLAEVDWTLGTGVQLLNATLAGGGSVSFNANVVGIAVSAGNNQIGVASTALAAQPTIIVTNASNAPVSGATGTWSVSAGGGSVSSGVFTTNASGLASVNWTLGAAGAQTLTATLSVGGSVQFNATIVTIAVNGGNGQTAGASTTLPTPPSIIVRDLANNPIAGATGTWAVTAGGGSVASPSFTTNASGIASVNWTLGPSGAQSMAATLTGGGSASFSATIGVVPPPPGSHLVIITGNNQLGIPRDTLSVSPTVEFRNASNVPISGAAVQWSVEAGANLGGVRSATVNTGADGRATNRWILGWAKSPQILKAKVAGVDSVTFTATLDVARMRWQIVSGNNQSAAPSTALANRLVVQVTDTFGAAIPGAAGTFAVASGGGSINKTALAIGATGRDSVTWTIGAAGAQSVTATIGVLGTLTFNATVVTPPPGGSKLFIIAGNSQKGTPKDTLGVSPVVEFRDASNNVIAGATIQWSVEAGTNLGGVKSASVVTGADGRASNRWILGWAKHTQTLKAKVAGVDSITFTASVDTARLRWRIIGGNNQTGPAGTPLSGKLVVELKDTLGNAFAGVGTFAVSSGAGTLSKTAVTTGAVGGRDSVTWTLGPSGTQVVTATIGALGSLTFNATIGSTSVAGTCAVGPRTVSLDMPLAQTLRFLATDANAPNCLDFVRARDLGRQYLVLFEDMPPLGAYTSGFFRGTANSQIFGYTISTAPPPSSASTQLSPTVAASQSANNGDDSHHAWDGPNGPIYELQPRQLPTGGASGQVIGRSSTTMVTYAVGDTLTVFMVGIPRLAIPDGNQKAVVRKVTNNIVFAEDVRLGTLTRENGINKNTPLTDAQMTAIAAEYDAFGHVQNNLLFNNTWNAATVAAGNKVVAVHTLMYNNNTWGYTVSNTNVFLFDYWVGTLDGATATLNQNAQRVADNLFTHEIAHQRHNAFNATSFGSTGNGNNWIEGFARFTERGAVAHRLLGVVNFSRTGNTVLPKNPNFGGASFINDVADYTKTATGVFTGYDAFAYFFDYFADQYSLAGGDWRAGVRNLLINGHTESGTNSALNSMLPGNTVYTLLTKSRIALYTDDYPNVVLPTSMQYTQYNLRTSRTSTSLDPRNSFPKINPGGTYTKSASLGAGAAAGFLITGDLATANAAINITLQPYGRGVVSITRIK